ncbi:MAG: peptidylprolyl isomerase [Comamonadaceae bacterium]|nr:MAG: peptidylprolyl isomerase [Comamonadaceae bacterium]
MPITQDSVVTLNYKVSDATTGQLVEAAQEPMAYLHGGYQNTLAKIEEALDGQDAGFQTTLTLAPADAFGEYDEALVRTIPKTEFPPGVKVGGQLRGQLDDGSDHVFTVVKIKGPQVLLDGNHPWAGKTLKFQLKVASVRPATAEEIAHRHVHGTGGHHH